MRRSLLIGILFVSKLSVSQDDNQVTQLTNYFKNQAQTFLFTYDSKTSKIDSLFSPLDSLIRLIFINPLPNWKERDFAPYYSSNRTFKRIIDSIEILPKRKANGFAYKKNVESITHNIKSLSLGFPKFESYYHFLEQLLSLNDTITLNYLKTHFGENVKLLNLKSKEEGINAIVILANIIVRRDPSSSLSIYLDALPFYDSCKNNLKMGEIEEKIGDLYSSNNSYAYSIRSFTHYEKAAHYYNLGGYVYDSLLCCLKAARQLFNFGKRPSSKDILYWQVRNRISNFLNAQEAAWNEKENFVRSYVLRAAVNAYGYRSNNKQIETIAKKVYKKDCSYADFDQRLFSLLGSYYWNIDEVDCAEIFYNLSVYVNYCDKDNYDLIQIMASLKEVAEFYASQKQLYKAGNYMAAAQMIAEKTQRHYDLAFLNLDNANILTDIGVYKISDSLIRQVLTHPDTLLLLEKAKIREYAYYSLHKQFSKMALQNPRFIDSGRFYLDRYNSVRSSLTDEFDELTNLESEYIDEKFNSKLSRLNDSVNILTNNLFIAHSDLDSTNNQNQVLRKNTTIQQDALNKLLDSTIKVKKELGDAVVELNNKKNEVKQLKIIWWKTLIISSIGVVCFLIMWLVVRYRNSLLRIKNEIAQQEFERENEQAKEQLRNTVTKMDADARNIAHNIRDDYTDFLEMLDTNVLAAKQMAEKGADYTAILFTKLKTNSKTWKLSDELSLMYAFYAVREAAGKHIKIIEEIPQNVIKRDPFVLSDVLPTLLHNSIKHRDPKKEAEFRIRIVDCGAFLQIIIIDNGIPSQKEKYLEQDDENKGLHFVKTRIEAHCKLNPSTMHLSSCFAISPLQEIGTEIKFYLPLLCRN